VDENDVVRDKAEILANLQPLGPGLTGHLDIAEFRVATAANMAVVTHEDNEYLDYHGQIIRSRLSPDVFFEPGQPRTRRIIGFVDRREGRDVAWKRIS